MVLYVKLETCCYNLLHIFNSWRKPIECDGKFLLHILYFLNEARSTPLCNFILVFSIEKFTLSLCDPSKIERSENQKQSVLLTALLNCFLFLDDVTTCTVTCTLYPKGFKEKRSHRFKSRRRLEVVFFSKTKKMR